MQASTWQSKGVIYDKEEQLFKCRYAGTGLKQPPHWIGGYATSNDGVRWTKPKLGLHEYNGSKDNNICFPNWFGPVIKDDLLYFYYCGQGHEWTSWPSGDNLPRRELLSSTLYMSGRESESRLS